MAGINLLNMRNEMGNQNASGIKEEEKAAVEVPEKPQEAAHEDEVKGENNIVPDDQNKDFHEKAAELPSEDLTTPKDSNAERHESEEKAFMSEQGNKEFEPPSIIEEASTESNHSLSQENFIGKADSSFEANNERPLESNLEEIMPINDKLQIHDQHPMGRESDAGKVESINSYFESENKFQDSKTVSDSTTQLEECQNLLSEENEKVLKLSLSCHIEEKENDGNENDMEESRDDLVLEESVCLEDNSLKMNICVAKCDTMSIEDKFGDGHENHGAVELPLKLNLNDLSSLPTETVPEVCSLNSLAAGPESEEKHIVHAEEIYLTYGRLDYRENNPDSDQARSSEQTINQLMIDNETQSIMLHEAYCKENGEENMGRISSRSDLEKVSHTEGNKVIYNGSTGVPEQTNNEMFVATEQEQFKDTKEVAILMPGSFSESNGFTTTDKYHEEKKITDKQFEEESEKRKEESSSARNDMHDGLAAEEIVSSFESIEEEIYLVAGSPTSTCKSENGLVVGSSTSSLNSHWGNGLCSEAAEDRNKCTVNLKQHSSCEVFIKEVSTSNAQKAYLQCPNPCSALENRNDVQELAQDVLINSGTVAETEILQNQSTKQQVIGETSPLPSSKEQESAARISIESIPDHPVTRVQLRKSPSFDFGVPLDTRSEESDQTPLLVRDKSIARSFSGRANVRFQNTMIQADDYGRKSLDYEPVEVEEKTIRMERSDSEISRDSFMSLLKRDVKASAELATEKKESQAADKKAIESPSEELALTSTKPNGKRKPRSSLFSACMCCTAAIH